MAFPYGSSSAAPFRLTSLLRRPNRQHGVLQWQPGLHPPARLRNFSTTTRSYLTRRYAATGQVACGLHPEWLDKSKAARHGPDFQPARISCATAARPSAMPVSRSRSFFVGSPSKHYISPRLGSLECKDISDESPIISEQCLFSVKII